MEGLLHPQLTFDEVGDRGASRAQRFSGRVRNIRHRSDGKRRCLAVAPRGGIGDHLDSVRVEICNDGWLVVGERKVDDRPGQVEWIVEREATGGPSAVSIPVRLHLSMRAVCGFPPDSTMTAESTTAYAWIWLPQETEPVPVGRLDRDGVVLLFTYGRSYLERSNAIALYLPELPLRPGPQTPLVGVVAGCIRDAAPNGWGQRVIENSLAGQGASELGLLTYLLHSGSNRIGALDFQLSAEQYAPRDQSTPTHRELLDSAAGVEAGMHLSIELDRALLHGTSVGGVRPKATLMDGDRQLIAKLSSTTDTSRSTSSSAKPTTTPAAAKLPCASPGPRSTTSTQSKPTPSSTSSSMPSAPSGRKLRPRQNDHRRGATDCLQQSERGVDDRRS